MVFEGTNDWVLWIFVTFSFPTFLRSRNPFYAVSQRYHILYHRPHHQFPRVPVELEVDLDFSRSLKKLREMDSLTSKK